MNSIDARLSKLNAKAELKIARRLEAKQNAKKPNEQGYLTPKQIREAREKFGNPRCMICHKAPTIDKMNAVDHCHVTGKIRGILCQKCNTGLGYFNEDVELFKSALRYLSEHVLDPNLLSDEELKRLRLIQNR